MEDYSTTQNYSSMRNYSTMENHSTVQHYKSGSSKSTLTSAIIEIMPASTHDSNYKYVRGPLKNRGPCPGLNALANHGFIPRDGKNITPEQVKQALIQHLHAPEYIGNSLARSFKKLLRPDGTFDLVQLRGHNTFEHDASYTRLDVNQGGDNYSFQPDMFQSVLNDAHGGPLTMRSLARSWVRRDMESRSTGGSRLPWKLWISRLIETCSPAYVARLGGSLPRDEAITFFEDERYPDRILDDHRPLPKFQLFRLIFALLFWITLMKIGLVR